MKPPVFDYYRAASVDEALDVLDEREGARVIAGGQSLIPRMNLRLARPEALVDIGRLEHLRRVGVVDGSLYLGGLVTHATLCGHPAILRHAPLLVEAASHIGHQAIRERGTIGGSLAHGDPAAELIACCSALGASVYLQSSSGCREVPAREFVQGPYSTAASHNEIVTWIRIPLADDRRVGFYEVAPRPGDFARVGAVWCSEPENDKSTVALFGSDCGHMSIELGGDGRAADVLDAVRASGRVQGGLVRVVEAAVKRSMPTEFHE